MSSSDVFAYPCSANSSTARSTICSRVLTSRRRRVRWDDVDELTLSLYCMRRSSQSGVSREAPQVLDQCSVGRNRLDELELAAHPQHLGELRVQRVQTLLAYAAPLECDREPVEPFRSIEA